MQLLAKEPVGGNAGLEVRILFSPPFETYVLDDLRNEFISFLTVIVAKVA